MKASTSTLAACQAYRLQVLTLRCKMKNWKIKSSQYVATLNRFYDASNSLPPGLDLNDVNPDVYVAGIKAEAECDKFNADNQVRVLKARSQQKTCLQLIGREFGALMQTEADTLLLVKFQKYWRMANDLRKHLLDGIGLTTWHIDPNGPMFKEFSKAAGFSKPIELFSALIGAERAKDLKTNY